MVQRGTNATTENNPDVQVSSSLGLRTGFGGPPATITYNPTTDIYVVTPFGGEPLRYEADPDRDLAGFSYSSDGRGFMLFKSRDGSEASLLSETGSVPNAVATLRRPDNTTIPTSGDIDYTGEYLGRISLRSGNTIAAGTVTGLATINVRFGVGAVVSGEITERVAYSTDDQSSINPDFSLTDLTLTQTDLTTDGRVALDGFAAPQVMGDNITFNGTTEAAIQSGRYSGMVGGPDAGNFVGGIEIIYDFFRTEIGVITASQ